MGDKNPKNIEKKKKLAEQKAGKKSNVTASSSIETGKKPKK